MYPIFNTYVLPSFAAGVALPWAFPMLEQKSAAQTESPPPAPGGIQRGIKMAPTIAKIVGTQKIVQNGSAAFFEKQFGWTPTSFPSIFCSSLLSAAATSGFYADFNKSTLTGKILPLTPWQRLAIISREQTFLATEPANRAMKENCPKNIVVETACDFASGAMGSVAGHIPDTILSRMQKGRSLHPRHWMRGSPQRALALGIFNIVYEGVKKCSPTN